MKSLLHEKLFSVRYYEVGPSRLVRPATLLDYLQDAAAEHASLLHIGVQDLHHRDLTWVLSRLHLTVERYPGVGETVTVRTWPSTRGSLSSYREFEVLDQAGEIVARATTAWVVLDLVRRRPVRLADVLSDYPLEPRRAIADDFLRFRDDTPAFYANPVCAWVGDVAFLASVYCPVSAVLVLDITWDFHIAHGLSAA